MSSKELKTCDNAKCRGNYFEEIFVANVVPPRENSEAAESGRIRTIPASGYYLYRCISCGKLYDFRHKESDD